jgi:hypothetical protein
LLVWWRAVVCIWGRAKHARKGGAPGEADGGMVVLSDWGDKAPKSDSIEEEKRSSLGQFIAKAGKACRMSGSVAWQTTNHWMVAEASTRRASFTWGGGAGALAERKVAVLSAHAAVKGWALGKVVRLPATWRTKLFTGGGAARGSDMVEGSNEERGRGKLCPGHGRSEFWRRCLVTGSITEISSRTRRSSVGEH